MRTVRAKASVVLHVNIAVVAASWGEEALGGLLSAFWGDRRDGGCPYTGTVCAPKPRLDIDRYGPADSAHPTPLVPIFELLEVQCLNRNSVNFEC